MECETQEPRRDILNIPIYTNLKHTWYMCMYKVKQHMGTLNSSKVRQCFNQWNSSHEICYCESFRESKFDAKQWCITVKSTT